MAVHYTSTLSADMIVSEIEALTAWRDALLRHNLYGETVDGVPVSPTPPDSLMRWCEKESLRGGEERKSIDRVHLVFAELSRIGQELSTMREPMPAAVYDRFTQQFNAYIGHIRRLYQELSDKLGSVDGLTGLRTAAGLRAELKREQDRFDRKGTPFSIASIRVDHVEQLQSRHHTAQIDAIFAGVARSIAGTIRSFDDAFYLGQGEYLVILKHVEFMDACAVMDRLCGEIASSGIVLPDGQRVEVTASFGIGEAQEKEQPEGVLEHAKAARLQAEAAGGNRVQEYQERSALEHFARDLRRDK